MIRYLHPVKISLLLISIALTTSCGGEKPQISTIDPQFAITGQNLTITGENFGSEQNESFVTIGGVSPTISSYIEWTNTKIILRIPDFGESGLIYVHRQNQKSNPVLFSTLGSMPSPPETQTSYAPVIRQIRPASASIGQLIIIQGSGFGNSRNESAVFFNWAAERPHTIPAEASENQLIEARDYNSAYSTWNEREIHVQVCDGAASGAVQVSTPRGRSNTAVFEVNPKPGIKTIRDKRTYSLSYSVDIQTQNASPPNSIYLNCPVPASTASQLNKEILAGSSKPFVDNHHGIALFRLTDLKTGDNRRISVSYLVDVYNTETTVQPSLINIGAKPSTPNTWTQASAAVPSDNPGIKALAAKFTGEEQNPYLKARSIYKGILEEFTILAEKPDTPIQQTLLEKELNPYTAAILYCALCRAANIPAIPVAGILCAKTGSATPHYWVEFWIDGFGAVPVDITLGAGVADETFKLRDDHETYYFGNIDNQHLIFSYGETNLSQIDARGRVASRELNYALQNIWEEASGNIEAYSSYWSDINITGIYSN
ncbi:MAG: IPT/TIG domain-containing protein [Spirochaetaceae bacterium]|jgi:transglutaminase-like putative cysteine protease|nr:IPT/TIG domain-containing protein [Spirochaetaceae bacterium]